jgi:hypothetical protein
MSSDTGVARVAPKTCVDDRWIPMLRTDDTAEDLIARADSALCRARQPTD